jgi:hypothetical protein
VGNKREIKAEIAGYWEKLAVLHTPVGVGHIF